MNEKQLEFGFPPHAKGRETSEEAAEEIFPHVTRLAHSVLRWIITHGGSTCSEIEDGLGMRHQTASARIWELANNGIIEDSGTRRKTASGRKAIVWTVEETWLKKSPIST